MVGWYVGWCVVSTGGWERRRWIRFDLDAKRTGEGVREDAVGVGRGAELALLLLAAAGGGRGRERRSGQVAGGVVVVQAAVARGGGGCVCVSVCGVGRGVRVDCGAKGEEVAAKPHMCQITQRTLPRQEGEETRRHGGCRGRGGSRGPAPVFGGWCDGGGRVVLLLLLGLRLLVLLGRGGVGGPGFVCCGVRRVSRRSVV